LLGIDFSSKCPAQAIGNLQFILKLEEAGDRRRGR